MLPGEVTLNKRQAVNMTDDEIAAYFIITWRDAVAFEPVFPPRHEVAPTSYFGGLPRLPRHIAWPEADITIGYGTSAHTKRIASTFVGQIDLAELPSALDLGVPRHGTLFFFVDTAIEDLDFAGASGKGGRVIYWDQSTSDVPTRAAPANLGPCFGEQWTYYFRWIEHIVGAGFAPPSSFTCFAVEGKPLRVYDARYTGPRFQSEGPDDSDDLRRWKQEQNKRFVEINSYIVRNGPPTHSEPGRKAVHEAASPPVQRNHSIIPAEGDDWREKKRAWRGGEGFPYTWLDIEIFCGMLLRACAEWRGLPSKTREWSTGFRAHRARAGLLSSGTLEQLAKLAKAAIDDLRNAPRIWRMNQRLRTIGADIVQWLAAAKAAGRMAPVSAGSREQFLRWYDQIESQGSRIDPRNWFILHECLAEAYRTGPRICLAHSAETAKLVPVSWLADQRWQWATNVTGHGGRLVEHHLLGASGDISSEPAAQVPLMIFDTQDCFSWMWGDVGSITFWIDRQDLTERDFSKVHVTVR